MALTALGEQDEAVAATGGLVEAAEATGNPASLSFALLAYGNAMSGVDPIASLTATRRGLSVAQDNDNKANESLLAMTLCRYESDSGEPVAALESARLAISNYHDSGNRSVIGVPLANLACLFERLGRQEAAATLLGYGHTPMTVNTVPGLSHTIDRLCQVLGEDIYTTLAQTGRAMTLSAIATYAYEQIDAARAQLEQLR
jgi:hypothetical protein